MILESLQFHQQKLMSKKMDESIAIKFEHKLVLEKLREFSCKSKMHQL